jgi:hypothetical protein
LVCPVKGRRSLRVFENKVLRVTFGNERGGVGGGRSRVLYHSFHRFLLN